MIVIIMIFSIIVDPFLLVVSVVDLQEAGRGGGSCLPVSPEHHHHHHHHHHDHHDHHHINKQHCKR